MQILQPRNIVHCLTSDLLDALGLSRSALLLDFHKECNVPFSLKCEPPEMFVSTDSGHTHANGLAVVGPRLRFGMSCQAPESFQR